MIDDLLDRYYNDVPLTLSTLTAAVDSAIQALSDPVVLDAGCGREATLVKEFSNRAEVYGADLDCENNGRIFKADLASLPFPDAMFDIVYSRSVFEHLSDPYVVLRELRRVLKPGGKLILVTPNKYDYTSIASLLTPQWFHRWYLTKVCAMEYDTFPVAYRCNTPGWFRRLRDWEPLELRGVRHYPANLSFSRLLFRLGIAYDWTIAKLGLDSLQPTLFVVLRKPCESPEPNAGEESVTPVFAQR